MADGRLSPLVPVSAMSLCDLGQVVARPSWPQFPQLREEGPGEMVPLSSPGL